MVLVTYFITERVYNRMQSIGVVTSLGRRVIAGSTPAILTLLVADVGSLCVTVNHVYVGSIPT